MKKHLLLALLAPFALPALAQITLTGKTSVPSPGTKVTYYTANSEDGTDFRKSGADQTWNLSQVSGSEQIREYKEASKGSASSTELTSAVLVEGGAGAENYYIPTTTGWAIKGHHFTNVLEVVYTDVREFLYFPMTYKDVFNETFKGKATNIQSSQSFDREGTIKIEADGYGKLILPYDTVENVLRILSVYEYEDRFLNVKVADYVDTIITWYNVGTKVQIASFSNNYSNGFKGATTIAYLSEDDLVKVTVGMETKEMHQFALFPNPVKDLISVNAIHNGNINSIAILDLNGKELKAWTNSPNGPLSVGDLPRGLYVIRIDSAEGTELQRFVKE